MKSQLVKEVTYELGDGEFNYENERWSVDMLGWFYDDACYLLGKMYPQGFTRQERVRLTGGYTKVDGLVDIMGVPKRDKRILSYTIKSKCLSNKYSYSIPFGGGGVEITPPIPVGEEVWVNGLLEGYADGLDIGSYKPIVKEYMKYKALMIDDESATSMTAAKVHYEAFNLMVAQLIKNDDTRERRTYGAKRVQRGVVDG